MRNINKTSYLPHLFTLLLSYEKPETSLFLKTFMVFTYKFTLKCIILYKAPALKSHCKKKNNLIY